MTSLQTRVLLALDRLGTRYVIAGGYPRDKYFGQSPKDMDIWVYPTHPELKDDDAAFATANLRAAGDLWSTFGVSIFTQFFMYNKEDPDDPNTQCIDFVYRHPEVDVIFLNHYAQTRLELVNRFDCSLNRFVMVGGNPFYVEKSGVLTASPPPTFHQQHRTTAKRESKMQDKCLALTGIPLEVL